MDAERKKANEAGRLLSRGILASSDRPSLELAETARATVWTSSTGPPTARLHSHQAGNTLPSCTCACSSAGIADAERATLRHLSRRTPSGTRKAYGRTRTRRELALDTTSCGGRFAINSRPDSAIVHAGALCWHIRRYSVDCVVEPYGIYLATLLVVWGYSVAVQSAAGGEDTGTERLSATESWPDSCEISEQHVRRIRNCGAGR